MRYIYNGIENHLGETVEETAKFFLEAIHKK